MKLSSSIHILVFIARHHYTFLKPGIFSLCSFKTTLSTKQMLLLSVCFSYQTRYQATNNFSFHRAFPFATPSSLTAHQFFVPSILLTIHTAKRTDNPKQPRTHTYIPPSRSHSGQFSLQKKPNQPAKQVGRASFVPFLHQSVQRETTSASGSRVGFVSSTGNR